MTRIALVVFCVTAFVAVTNGLSPIQYGMEMSVRAYDAVCWYEKLKQFPNTKSKEYGMKCGGQAGQVKQQIKDDKMAKRYFGDWLVQLAMGGLPNEYGSACNKYLKSDSEPPADESDTLNDGASGSYPFRAFSYCLLQQLRKKFGDKAPDAVKAERTHSKKHWMSTLLDRDNEFRARHGVDKLQLVKDLNDAAQKWAEKNAAECNMEHSDNDDPDRQWRGKGTGESLSASGGDDEKEIAAYLASDGWYEEIKDYPYPGGYTGDGNDPLFLKIGHFTQTVWKESKYVGYGYAYNPNCAPFTRYIAARYSPAGNLPGAFTKNVLPVQD